MPPACAFRTSLAPICMLSAMSLLWAACGGGDIGAPRTGQVQVITTTTGVETDADGYAIILDARPGVSIGSNASSTLVAAEGKHTVELAGLSANCGVEAGTRRDVVVTANETVDVAFDVVCSSTTGGIHVVTATSGSQPDPDGYTVSLDQGTPQPIGTSGELTLGGLAAGAHTVGLSGVAANCTLQGDNPRTATVVAAQLTELTFSVTCVSVIGALAVTTSTSGTSLDPDGYSVQIDDRPGQPIGPSASVTIADLPAGSHTVLLAGVAPTCRVDGDNPRPAEITAGQTAALAFTVICETALLSWNPIASGTRADLTEVWGSSPTDVFTVGEDDNDPAPGGASLILHYDGVGWSRQLKLPSIGLRSVWGTSATNVFAVGFDFLASAAKILHFDGTGWQDVPGLGSTSEQFALAGVWGSSATDVFAVGSAFDGEFERALIFHFDGFSWQRMPVEGSVSPALSDVWGSSSRDVYAVGRDDEVDPATGVVLHFDGSTWSPVLQEESLALSSVWASSATDVFACGFEVKELNDGTFEVKGTVRHFDGSAWSRMPLPTDRLLQEIWGTSAADVFAVGDGVVLHYDGTAWSEARPTSKTLLGVWASSPVDAFAVGVGGLVLHGVPLGFASKSSRP
jgi:hypothetical protein